VRVLTNTSTSARPNQFSTSAAVVAWPRQPTRRRGFGLIARPVGAFIIRNGELSWRPAVDVNRIVLGGQVVAIVALLTVRATIKARVKAKRHPKPPGL
jgi:hypothetical protein